MQERVEMMAEGRWSVEESEPRIVEVWMRNLSHHHLGSFHHYFPFPKLHAVAVHAVASRVA